MKMKVTIELTEEERQILQNLEALLPEEDKFMEIYKDVFAAQDLGREGIGWLLRRLFLAPRMAALGLGVAQKITRPVGAGLRLAGRAAQKLVPPLTLRGTLGRVGKSFQESNEALRQQIESRRGIPNQ